jgi:hypothetical protein
VGITSHIEQESGDWQHSSLAARTIGANVAVIPSRATSWGISLLQVPLPPRRFTLVDSYGRAMHCAFGAPLFQAEENKWIGFHPKFTEF